MLVSDYLGGPETNRRRELVWGVVREPPAPFYSHQRLITTLAIRLERHVRRHRLGEVCVSPLDVVLDAENALIVQPDLIFVSNARLGIIRNQVWGAPDLAIEVLSAGTRRYDYRQKRSWYRKYGVREYWVVDPLAREIAVHVFDAPRPRIARFGMRRTVQSTVLPALKLRVKDVLSV